MSGVFLIQTKMKTQEEKQIDELMNLNSMLKSYIQNYIQGHKYLIYEIKLIRYLIREQKAKIYA